MKESKLIAGLFAAAAFALASLSAHAQQEGAMAAAAAPNTQFAELPLANIEVLNGTNAGKTLSLTKAVTSLGRPGVQVVVITRAPEGYSVAHVEGDKSPLLNGDPMPRQPHPLKGGDILDLSGILMAFRAS